MSFAVRKASLDDLEALVSFIVAEAMEAEGRQQPPKTVEKGIRAGIEDPSLATYWVLESKDAGIVGSVSSVKEWSDWHAAYYWWIQSIFILPEFRGKGLMKLLVDAVRERARKENALEIRLYVYEGNVRARRAYTREGFVDLPYRIMTLKP